MTTPEFAARIELLVALCDRALAGESTEALAREAPQQALSDKGCPLRQATSGSYAGAIRQGAQHRAEMVVALDASSLAYKAAVTGLKRHLVALLDADPERSA